MVEPAEQPARPAIWIVEDETPAAQLAVELCESGEVDAHVFRSALPFLRASRERRPPAAVVLDWQLERGLSAGLFLATRHRFPRVPVIYWTASGAAALPSMIRDDPLTRVVDKTAGAAAFEGALAWALDGAMRGRRRRSARTS